MAYQIELFLLPSVQTECFAGCIPVARRNFRKMCEIEKARQTAYLHVFSGFFEVYLIGDMPEIIIPTR